MGIRKLISSGVLLMLLTLFCSGKSFAIPVYDEASSGDLSQNMWASTILSTIPGATNDVLGTTSWTTTISTWGALDIDNFRFNVLSGQTANNFSFSFSNSLLTANEAVGGYVGLYQLQYASGSLTYLSSAYWLVRAPGSIFGGSTPSPLQINLAAPLGAGQYLVSIAPNSRSINGGYVPYSLSFDVSAPVQPAAPANQTGSVPEPSTLFLLGSGLTGLAAMRRFRSGR